MDLGVDTLILTCLLFIIQWTFDQKISFLVKKMWLNWNDIFFSKFHFLKLPLENHRNYPFGWWIWMCERNFNLKNISMCCLSENPKKLTIFVKNDRKIWINSCKYLGDVDYYQTDSASILKKNKRKKNIYMHVFWKINPVTKPSTYFK